MEITVRSSVSNFYPLCRTKAMGTRIVNALEDSCYWSVADLVSSSRDEIIRHCRGIGQSCLDEIERVLGENGLSLDTEVKDKEWAFVKQFTTSLVGKCVRHNFEGIRYGYMRVRKTGYVLDEKEIWLWGEGFSMEVNYKGDLLTVEDLYGEAYDWYKKPKDLPRMFKVIPEAEFIAKHIVWKRMVEIAKQELKKI